MNVEITGMIPAELMEMPWVKEAVEDAQLFSVMLSKAKQLDELECAIETYIAEVDSARMMLSAAELNSVFNAEFPTKHRRLIALDTAVEAYLNRFSKTKIMLHMARLKKVFENGR